MKTSFLALTLLAFIVLGYRNGEAQAYRPYYYDPYWDVQYQHYLQWQQYLQYLQQYDPYYELHVIHYQLYLQPFQAYQVYAPCCYAWNVPPRRRSFHTARPAIKSSPRVTRRR